MESKKYHTASIVWKFIRKFVETAFIWHIHNQKTGKLNKSGVSK